MEYSYRTSGTCSREIRFEIVDGLVRNIKFVGGCNGNLKAITKILEGWSPQEIIKRVEGITCEGRPTSCTDQLATAIKKAMQSQVKST